MLKLNQLFFVLFAMSVGVVWAKPIPPLSVDLRTETEPVAASTWPVTVVVKTSQASSRVKVTLSLPPKTSLVTGEVERTVDLQRGEAVTLDYLLLLPPELVGTVRVKAESGDAQSVYYAVQDEMVLNSSSNRKPLARSLQSVPRDVERGGETVREYSLSH
jgi:uncharacterized protein (DUF58 family)